MTGAEDDAGTTQWERRKDALGLTVKLCPECDTWSSEESACPICGNEERSEDVSQREIRLEVKETRIGQLLVYADEDAEKGLRGMTEDEIKLHDYIENLVREFDEGAVEAGRVGTVRFDEAGEPTVEWCSDEARAAAGGEFRGA